MKNIVLNLEDLISKENISEYSARLFEIPYNKAIELSDFPRSKNPLHYQVYYTDVIKKLLKEKLIKEEQIEWGDDDGKLYILSLENVEYLNTVAHGLYPEKRKIWSSCRKEAYKLFIEEHQELCIRKIEEVKGKKNEI